MLADTWAIIVDILTRGMQLLSTTAEEATAGRWTTAKGQTTEGRMPEAAGHLMGHTVSH